MMLGAAANGCKDWAKGTLAANMADDVRHMHVTAKAALLPVADLSGCCAVACW